MSENSQLLSPLICKQFGRVCKIYVVCCDCCAADLTLDTFVLCCGCVMLWLCFMLWSCFMLCLCFMLWSLCSWPDPRHSSSCWGLTLCCAWKNKDVERPEARLTITIHNSPTPTAWNWQCLVSCFCCTQSSKQIPGYGRHSVTHTHTRTHTRTHTPHKHTHTYTCTHTHLASSPVIDRQTPKLCGSLSFAPSARTRSKAYDAYTWAGN
jgi:hypothetical protein